MSAVLRQTNEYAEIYNRLNIMAKEFEETASEAIVAAIIADIALPVFNYLGSNMTDIVVDEYRSPIFIPGLFTAAAVCFYMNSHAVTENVEHLIRRDKPKEYMRLNPDGPGILIDSKKFKEFLGRGTVAFGWCIDTLPQHMLKGGLPNTISFV